MSSDDSFDQRVRELLSMAGSDAPTDLVDIADAPTTARRSAVPRVLLVAAAMAALVAGLGVVVSRRSGQDVVAPTPSSTSAPGSTTSGPVSSLPQPERCTLPGVVEYDDLGSMHTVVPNTQPLEASVTVHSDGPYCSGDTITVNYTVRNRGVGVETFEPYIILSGGANKYSLATPVPLRLEPGQQITTSEEVTLPGVPPGQYWIGLYGLGAIANITLANPPMCDATHLTTSVATDVAGGGMRFAFVTATNVAEDACFLGPVRRIGNVGKDLAGQTVEQQLVVTAPVVLPSLPRLESHVLQPNASAGIVVATSNGCLDGAVVERPIGLLALHLSYILDNAVTVDLVDKGFQTACSFGISDWGGAPV